MLIGELPADLRDDAVALWHTAGLTRPWNDPHDDLRRALHGASSTVWPCGLRRRLVAAAEAWLADHVPKVQFMVRRDNDAVLRFYEQLGYAGEDVTVLSRRFR